MKNKNEILFSLRKIKKELAFSFSDDSLQNQEILRDTIIFIETNYPENQAKETD